MANGVKSGRRTWRAAHLRARELRMIAKGLASTDHPILAHIIPMRRCNLACTYCNEYDDHSKPVPLETVCQRLDLLAALGHHHRHHQRRRTAAASGPGRDHRAHPPPPASSRA